MFRGWYRGSLGVIAVEVGFGSSPRGGRGGEKDIPTGTGLREVGLWDHRSRRGNEVEWTRVQVSGFRTVTERLQNKKVYTFIRKINLI